MPRHQLFYPLLGSGELPSSQYLAHLQILATGPQVCPYTTHTALLLPEFNPARHRPIANRMPHVRRYTDPCHKQAARLCCERHPTIQACRYTLQHPSLLGRRSNVAQMALLQSQLDPDTMRQTQLHAQARISRNQDKLGVKRARQVSSMRSEVFVAPISVDVSAVKFDTQGAVAAAQGLGVDPYRVADAVYGRATTPNPLASLCAGPDAMRSERACSSRTERRRSASSGPSDWCA